ncbi:unnamed protein product, partial [Musa hybrid cultivar]
PLHRTDASSIAEVQIRRPSFHVQFPPQPLLSCAAPSIIEGEDRSFLCPRRHRLQHPLPSSIASFVTAITVIQKFLHHLHPLLSHFS